MTLKLVTTHCALAMAFCLSVGAQAAVVSPEDSVEAVQEQPVDCSTFKIASDLNKVSDDITINAGISCRSVEAKALRIATMMERYERIAAVSKSCPNQNLVQNEAAMAQLAEEILKLEQPCSTK